MSPKIILIPLLLLMCLTSVFAQNATSKKELRIPEDIWLVPKENDYSNAKSDYSFSRMIESDNIALFWHKEYGKAPLNNPDKTKQFNPHFAIQECERFYNFYIDRLKLVEKGNSLTDKYKLLVFVFGGDEQTAFGGGAEDVGVLWTPAVRINKAPYGALAHEIGHSFQYLSRKDSKTGPQGPVMEMSAQYMLWQVYPEWLTFENYHLQGFLEGTHFSFLHPVNMYHSPFVLEYWSDKHGLDFWGKLSRNTRKDEDVITTYKRLNNLTQDEFNTEMFDACRKFVTWDISRIDSIAKPYRNIHKSKFNNTTTNWYQIDSVNAPQNYGYNAVKLDIPENEHTITLEFQGLAGTTGYNAIKTDKAGWRYGFIAYQKDAKRTYSKIHKNSDKKIKFRIPEHTEHLWFVVMGAPTEHWIKPPFPSEKDKPTKDEQWPYRIKINKTNIDKTFILTTN